MLADAESLGAIGQRRVDGSWTIDQVASDALDRPVVAVTCTGWDPDWISFRFNRETTQFERDDTVNVDKRLQDQTPVADLDLDLDCEHTGFDLP